MEYLDERYPQQPLLPKDIIQRANVRFGRQIILTCLHLFV